MRDGKTFIAEMESELARTEDILTELTQAMEAFAEVGGELTPEMLESFEALGSLRSSLAMADTLPAYAIPI